MGYIKEPKGIDLIIPPSKLSKKEANEISDFIKEYKNQKKKIRKKLGSATLNAKK